MSFRQSLHSLLAALLMAAALLCPALAQTAPEAGTAPAPPALPASEAAPFDALAGLALRAPSGFAELAQDSVLFQESAAQAVLGGRLLKLYLPQHIEHEYRTGNPDAVTRQVLICALEGQTRPLDARDAEILARSAEGFFNGFARIPRSSTDTPAQEEENRESALLASLESGRPLLVDSVRTASAYLHTCLIHFAMDEAPKAKKKADAKRAFLPCALATAAVPVKDTVLFLTASSLLGQDRAEPHLAWVKDTAAAFADAIARANKEAKR